ISVQIEDGSRREWPGAQLIRFRRTDAEKALGLGPTRGLGFCGLLFGDAKANGGGATPCAVKLSAADGSSAEFPVTPRLVSDVELRDLMLGYLSSVEFMGNNQVEAFFRLDDYLGDALIRHSRAITRSIVGGASLERFETAPGHFKGSIVVCLYGKAEFQFVQNALFAAGPGARDYEYIYVSNSPELIEMLCKTAQISQRAYGLNVSVVMLPGNAWFGAANNVAAQHARSRRLLIVNPDVFPMDRNWAAQHNDAVEQLRAEQTKLFGPRLVCLGPRARFLAARRQGRVDAAAAPQGRRHREPLAVHPRMARPGDDGTARPRDAERAIQASRRLMSDKISTSDKNPMSDKKTVLLVSLFHPELVRGGAQQVCYELFEGLRDDPEYRPVLLASIDATYPALYKSGARITGFDERPDEFLFLSRDYDHWWHRTS